MSTSGRESASALQAWRNVAGGGGELEETGSGESVTEAGLNNLRADRDALNFNFLVMDTAERLSSPKITHHCVIHRLELTSICITCSFHFHTYYAYIPYPHPIHVHGEFAAVKCDELAAEWTTGHLRHISPFIPPALIWPLSTLFFSKIHPSVHSPCHAHISDYES